MQLTVRDVAKLFALSEKTIYRMIQRQEIPAYRVHDQYRFNRAELAEWAASKRINFSPELFEEPSDTSAPLPALSEALEAGNVFYRVGGADKKSVFQSVLNMMNLPEDVDRDFLCHVLMAREELASTAIGDGIAIPHVRNPIILHVNKPSISLCFLETPVEFGALDGKPIHSLFMLISPSTRSHLYLLSRLAFALKDEGFRKTIEHQAFRDEIFAELHRVEASFKAPGQESAGTV